MRKYLLSLAAALVLFATAAPAQAQICVGYTSGRFGTCNDATAANVDVSKATAGILGTVRGGTGLNTFGGAGALLYSTSSSALAALAAGTSGYLLQSGGTGAPSWVAPSSIAAGLLTLAGQTLWATPAAGEVGYISANKTFAKAIATAGSTTDALCVYQGTAGSCVTMGNTTCYVDAGLTLAAGDVLYLSASTAGRFTNVPPSSAGQFVNRLARLVDASGYNSGAGSAQSCVFIPSGIIVAL